jgi:hypothetical protein
MPTDVVYTYTTYTAWRHPNVASVRLSDEHFAEQVLTALYRIVLSYDVQTASVTMPTGHLAVARPYIDARFRLPASWTVCYKENEPVVLYYSSKHCEPVTADFDKILLHCTAPQETPETTSHDRSERHIRINNRLLA